MDLKTLLENNANDIEIEQAILKMHSFDIAKTINTLKAEDIKRVETILSTEQLADVLSYLEPEEAAKFLENQSLEDQVSVVQNLEPDDAADIINELNKADRNELIKELDDDEPVLDLIQYKDETAGSYMNNDILAVNQDMDVKDITKTLIKNATDLKSVKTIFVIDEQFVYQGQISLKQLIRAKTPFKASDLLKKEPVLHVYDDVDDIIKHMKHYGSYDIATTDDDNHLLGAITTDDLFDIYRDEAVDDIEKLSLLPDTDIKSNVLTTAIKRLPWLIVLMFLSIPLALITSNYEAIVTSVVILALFQPLLLDSGGNVAHQTLAITLVGLTYKEGIHIKEGIKEALSGIITGFILAILAFVAAYILADLMAVETPILVSIVVSLSLWSTVIIAPIIGFLVPIVLDKLNFDPAIASGPFITTVIDILCLVIYFGLATMFLGGMIHG